MRWAVTAPRTLWWRAPRWRVERYPKIKFLFYGDEQQVKPLLDSHKDLITSSELHHTPENISADLKPSLALRTRP